MKKTWLIILTVFVVIFSIIAAGCVTPETTNPPATETPSGPVVNPALTISFEKIGDTYNIGDTFTLTLPSNTASTGYSWVVTKDSGLNITEENIAPEQAMPGAPGKTVFTISADKEGNFDIEIAYKQPWEGGATACIFKDTMNIVKTDEAALTEPRGSIEFDSLNINPYAGETVKIITNGNPTTGYEWIASGTEGLTVSDAVYTAPETTMVGVGGTYEWLVKADKAGTYTFTAEYKRPFETEPISKFTTELIFIAKEKPETVETFQSAPVSTKAPEDEVSSASGLMS